MRIKLLLFLLLLPFFILQLQAQELETVVQKGHSGAVKGITLSPDGKYLFTASRDRTVKLWETATGRELRTYYGMSRTVYTVAVSSNMKYVAAAGNDYDIYMWEIETGKLMHVLKGHRDRLTSLAFHPKDSILISAGNDWDAYVWNYGSGELLNKFKVSPDKGLGLGISLSFLPDGSQIITGADNRKAMLNEYMKGEVTKEFISDPDGHCGGCGTLAKVSPDGKFLYTGSHRGDLIRWNIKTGEKEIVFTKDKKYFTSVSLSNDGKTLVTTDKDSVFVWNTSSGNLKAKYFAHEKDINDGMVSPDGRYMYTACDDHTVVKWDIKRQKPVRTFTGYLSNQLHAGIEWDEEEYWQQHIARYYAYKTLIKLSPNGRYFIKGKTDSSAVLYDLETGKKVRKYIGHSKAVVCFDFSDDGKYLATGSADHTVKIWDVETAKLLQTLKGHREIIFSVDFSADGSRLLSGSWDGTMRIFDTHSGDELKYFRTGNASPFVAKFSPNQIYIAVATLNKEMQLLESDAGESWLRYVGHTDFVSSVDFSLDGMKMLTGSHDGKAKLWDLRSGFQIQKFDGDQTYVHDAKFSADSKSVFTAGAKGSVIMWDAQTGKEIKRFDKHPNMVTSIDITPDNATLISCDTEGMIKIWNIASGKEILSFIPFDDTNFLVTTPKGYFDGTDKGKQSVIFVKGMKSYGLDQFFEDFYQPDLYPEAFHTGGNIQGSNINRKLKTSPPPAVEILSPENYSVTEGETVEIEFSVEDSGGGIDEIKVLHNGKRLGTDYRLPRSKKEGQNKKFSVGVAPIKGDNLIQISAFSKGRIESDFAEISLRHNLDESMPDCYMMSIGINKYENAVLNLNYARSDAEAFSKLMKKRGRKLFRQFYLYELTDENATKDSILNVLSEIASKAKSQDVFVFYYAGHGAMIENDFYFIPYDCVRIFEEENLKQDALYAGIVQEQLKKIGALKQIVIMDACHSGGGAELLAQRGASEAKAIAQMSRSSGVHVLASAGSEQFATEFSQLKHGLFTYILLDALGGSADGAPKDGQVTVYEMKSYIDNLVPEYTKKYRGASQYPYTFSRGNDFPLSLE